MIGERLEELGAVRIDADVLAREAVEPGSPGSTQILRRFGSEVLQDDGTLNRQALGQLVFGDSEARSALNAIVHPEVRRLAAARIAEASAIDPEAVVVYEIPLLAETGGKQDFDWDLIVTAEAPAEIRIARLAQFRDMSEVDARARISAQAPERRRREIADVVIDTSGTMDETLAQIDDLWHRVGHSSTRRR